MGFAFVFFWIAFSVVAGIVASAKGRSGLGYFALSLIVSPLIGLILAAALPKVVAAAQRDRGGQADMAALRKCPECAELIRREARKCKHCGSAVEPLAAAGDAGQPRRRYSSIEEPPTWRPGVTANTFNVDVLDTERHQRTIAELAREGDAVDLVRQEGDRDAPTGLAVRAVRPRIIGSPERGIIGRLPEDLSAELRDALELGKTVHAQVVALGGGGNTGRSRTVRLQISRS